MLSKYLLNNIVKYINHKPDLQKFETIFNCEYENKFNKRCMISFTNIERYVMNECHWCRFGYCDMCLSKFCEYKTYSHRFHVCPRCFPIIENYKCKICVSGMYFLISNNRIFYCKTCSEFCEYSSFKEHRNHDYTKNKDKLYEIIKK